MTVKIPGYSTLSGSPEAILKLLEESQLWDEATGDSYIEKIQNAALRAFEINLEVSGDTYEERAASLLNELAKHHMITIEE